MSNQKRLQVGETYTCIKSIDYRFLKGIKYKCEKYGIKFVEADRWFPSSKTCSCCGKIKSDLKLKDRVFSCECGFKMDRDLNASINLANYQIQRA